MKRWILGLSVLMFVLIVSACGGMDNEPNNQNQDEESKEATIINKEASEKAGSTEVVEVEMINSRGEKIGIATLKQEKTGVNIEIEASDLPKGTHGFHIHEKGVCEKPDFKSAGEHFNPIGKQHGFDNPEGPHAGDLPNIEVGEDGKVTESFLNEMVTLQQGEENSLLRDLGTSLIIHADPDDNISQPAGNAGERIACGVIKK